MVYFVESPDGIRVKIGTTIRLSERIKQLRSKYGAVNVIAVMDGGFAEESALHARFAAHRVEGEWFVCVSLIRDFIRDYARAWDGIDEVPLSPKIGIRIDEEALGLARMAAGLMRIPLSDYVSSMILEAADEDIQREARKLIQETAP